MPELRAPLRLTWDLPPDPDRVAEQWHEITRARVLFVELRVPAGGHGALEGLASEIGVEGTPRVTLVADAATAAACLKVLPPAAGKQIDLSLLPPHGECPELVTHFKSVTFALWSTPDGLERFADTVRAARAVAGAVAVLNPPAPAPPLSPEDRCRAVEVWAREESPGMDLRVHDLFLARDLGLDPFPRYAGCQAADGLGHLEADGTVFACRTLPVALGDLHSQGLEQIWAGEARSRLRRTLANAPQACCSCSVAASCRGGCRGLGQGGKTAADLRERDPSCPGPLPPGEEGA